MNRPRILVALLSVAAVAALSACGSQPEQKSESYQSVNAQVAETEGVYVDLQGVKYQVQVSRQLNPSLLDDRDYLSGLSAADRKVAKDEEYFAIFLRGENDSDAREPNATQFEIRDTQENIYRPLIFDGRNVWAWRPVSLGPGEVYPFPNSPAGERPPQGSLLLFKIREFSLSNRPLELIITSPQGRKGIVNLDV